MEPRRLTTFGGGARLSEQALRDFEQAYGLRLPFAYRLFLMETNGGRPARDLFYSREASLLVRVRLFYGLEPSVLPCHLGWIREMLSTRLPAELLAIATTDCADRLCLSTTTGGLLLWQPPAPLVAIADSFDEYLEGVYRDTESPTATSSIWPVRSRK